MKHFVCTLAILVIAAVAAAQTGRTVPAAFLSPEAPTAYEVDGETAAHICLGVEGELRRVPV